MGQVLARERALLHLAMDLACVPGERRLTVLMALVADFRRDLAGDCASPDELEVRAAAFAAELARLSTGLGREPGSA